MLFKLFEIFSVFLRLGLISFGGPIAHLGFFREEFVVRRKWINEHSYVDLVALCQFLPGPASSQVGIALGLSRGGILGSICAWLGFTLPSAIILVLFGLGISSFSNMLSAGWLHGLMIVAASVVAQALWGMTTKLCPDWQRVAIMLGSAMVALLLPSIFGQLLVIFVGGFIGLVFLKKPNELPHVPMNLSLTRFAGTISLLIFFSLLILLPIISRFSGSNIIAIVDSFFRAGSLVFGGGHVVLPLLQSEVVTRGWVTKDLFMAGYGAAQAVPGPLFSFTAYLGAVSNLEPSKWVGALIALAAAFLPSFLLVWGILPFWESLRKNVNVRCAMQGINSAVVGLLLAAFYSPVCTSAIHGARDFVLALLGYLLLVLWKLPPWLVVLSCIIASQIVF